MSFDIVTANVSLSSAILISGNQSENEVGQKLINSTITQNEDF